MATRSGLLKWFPEFFDNHQAFTVFDLLVDYIKSGKLEIDKKKLTDHLVYHDPCNYGRKSEETFGQNYYQEGRWILNQISDNWSDLFPKCGNQYCCGGGGGTLLTPYKDERILHGMKKIEQIKRTEAEIVVVPCHSCHGQIKAMLREAKMGHIEVMYLWQVVAEVMVKK